MPPRSRRQTTSEVKAKNRGAGVYLPALPSGHMYQVTVTGPRGDATIQQVEDGVLVRIQPHGQNQRAARAKDLAAGARMVADAFKALDKVARAEERLRAQGTEALALFQDEATGSEPDED